ncbi:MAG: hypothetical protein ACKVUS_06560 [Saprospiraceae bacterium]
MENASRQHYLDLAYQRAGIEAAAWLPERGFRANEAILNKVYRYYQAVYFENPDKFLWAGLARLTGGQVLFGMGNAVKIARDPCVLTQEIVAVAKDIFESLAWQHELFLRDPEQLILVCRKLETNRLHSHPYAGCWQNLLSHDYEKICLGNKMLLENEQRNTIQPHYEIIRKDGYANRYFRFTRFVMRNIHPHHRRFIFDFPLSDVTRFDDRWQWISHANGMWPTWVGLPQKERDRLVALSNEDVVAHNW